MKKLMLLVLTLVNLWPSTTFSKETDQYLMMDQILPDNASRFDQTVLSSFQDSIKAAGGFKGYECPVVVEALIAPLKKYDWPEKIEKTLDNFYCDRKTGSLCFDTSFASLSDIEYWKKTIYGNFERFRFVTPARTINFNGTYLGLDKVGHFVAQGSDYYRQLINSIRKTPHYGKIIDKPTADLIKKWVVASINIGVAQENGIFGLSASNVFSYGDLEANYQGMMFMFELCHSANSPLKGDAQKGYVIDHKLSVSSYFSPYMDESFNNNYFAHKNGDWLELSKQIKQHCEKANGPVYQKRLNTYQNWEKAHKSSNYLWDHLRLFNRQYLREQISLSQIPNPEPFALKNICGF